MKSTVPIRLGIARFTLLTICAVAGLASCTSTENTSNKDVEGRFIEAIRPTPGNELAGDLIHSGHLILYGQDLSPPYTFDLDDGVLRANGVLIEPYLLPPWEQGSNDDEISDVASRMSQVANLIEMQEGQLRTSGVGDVNEKVLDFVVNELSGVSAEWNDENNLEITLDDSTYFQINFGPRRRGESPRDDVTAISQLKEQYESILLAGGLLAIGYGVSLSVPPEFIDEFRSQYDEAMEQRSLEALEQALSSEELAREVLFATEVRGK